MSCYHPVTIRSPNNEKAFIEVPCGKCAGCRKKLRNEWYFRLKIESRFNISRFITLTYDEDNIPYHVDEDSVIHYDVNKDHLTKFFKKMRKTNKFKYFVVSEYGKDGRPHYHLLLFSQNRIDIERYWNYGFIYDLPAKSGSFKYVCKYLLKGSKVPEGSNPNFMRCSKRPAIGYDYLDQITVDKLSQPVVFDHNMKMSMPRYYRKKLYDQLDENQRKVMKDCVIEQLESYEPNHSLHEEMRRNNSHLTVNEYVKYKESKDDLIQKKINNGK